MTTIFRLDASIRGDASVTRAVADTLESALVAGFGPTDDLTVIRRDLGRAPLPSTVWPLSMAAAFTPAEQRSPEQQEAAALASALADELALADAIIIGSPLYNFGVSQHLKAWFDVLITEPRFAPRTSTIAGKPAVIVVARGGGYGAGSPREGWDHGTAWVRRIMADVWGLDVQTIETEFTLAPGRPEMAAFVPLAAESLANAHAQAASVGAGLAERLSRTVAV